GLLKLPKELRKLLAEAGVGPARHIVVYSGMQEAADVKAATRLFWILENCGYPRVSLLNGGFAKWKAEGKPVEKGASKVTAIDVESIDLNKFNATLAERADVLRLIEHHTGTLLDLRVPEEYAGISKKDFVDTAGHIPRAQSCPAGDFVQGPYFEFKTAGDLAKVLGEVELKPGGPVVTYCNTGRDATIGYFGLRLQGIDKVKVYDGSMVEWSKQPAVKVEDPR
ncbi:MAG: sulfurtransferase, partial [Candidatus Hydrogenedentes bacterium]|nr:sulfurtransferase [Candidatus Hydrogenedentota bacterium]